MYALSRDVRKADWSSLRGIRGESCNHFELREQWANAGKARDVPAL